MKTITFISVLFATLYSLNYALSQTTDCLSFDGFDNYVQADNIALNAINTNDFTFEAWIRGDETAQTMHPTLFSNRAASTSGMMFFFHGIWGTSNYKMLTVQLNGANHFIINNGTYNGSLLDNECHHVAITREGNLLSFYADGVLFGTKSIVTSSTVSSPSTTLQIGKDLPTNNTFNGDISQVRIWNVARTSSEIFSNQNTSLPGTEPNLVGYWELNEGVGQSVLDKTGTANGQLGATSASESTDPNWVSDFCDIISSEGCLYFNGISNYVQADNVALNAINTDDFTFEAWIRGDEAAQTTHPTIFSNRAASTSGMMFFFHGLWGSSNYKMLTVQLNGVNHFIINNGTYNGSLLDNQCHHVAITREGNLLSFYADGVLFGTKSIISSSTVSSPSNIMQIGQDVPTNNTFDGNISQVRIWNAARTSNEILSDKDVSLSGTEANLVGYWELNEGTGQTALDKTGTANGLLGATNSPESVDPVWDANCCTISGQGGSLEVIDNADAPTIKVYPNPAINNVTIEFDGSFEYVLFDMTGRVISTGNGTNEVTVGLADLVSGTYLIKISSQTTELTQKLLKQ